MRLAGAINDSDRGVYGVTPTSSPPHHLPGMPRLLLPPLSAVSFSLGADQCALSNSSTLSSGTMHTPRVNGIEKYGPELVYAYGTGRRGGKQHAYIVIHQDS